MTPLLTCPKSYGVPRRRFLPGLGEWRHSQGTCSEIGDELLQDMRCSSLLCLTTCTHNRGGGMVFTDPTEVTDTPGSRFSHQIVRRVHLLPSFSGEHLRGVAVTLPFGCSPAINFKMASRFTAGSSGIGVAFICVKTCMICLADTLWTIIRCHPIHSPPKHRPLQFYLRQLQCH